MFHDETGPLLRRHRATVGRNAVLFYGADIGPGAHVAPHSLVVKGDAPGGGRAYAGHPARPVSQGSLSQVE